MIISTKLMNVMMSVVNKKLYKDVNQESKEEVEEVEVFEDYLGVENFCKKQNEAELKLKIYPYVVRNHCILGHGHIPNFIFQ